MDSSLAFPAALDTLRARVFGPEDPEGLGQILRVLQRLGLTQHEIGVHLERLRVENDLTVRSSAAEENALLALQMNGGTGGAEALRWDAAQMAALALPAALTSSDLERGVEYALRPSDLLPARPSGSDEPSLAPRLMRLAEERIRSYGNAPTQADFFRVPKSSFTTRPAALLAWPDRVVYEGLAAVVEEQLVDLLSSSVRWPRDRERSHPPEKLGEAARDWSAQYVVKADVAGFYESIDHGILGVLLAHYLDLPSTFTRAAEAFLDAVMAAPFGLPQGPGGSETFAAAYLLPVDLILEEEQRPFARYADDYFFPADSMLEAREALLFLEEAMRGLGMRLNSEKTQIVRQTKFVAGLDGPSRRVLNLRRRMAEAAENSLLEEEDSERLADELSRLGVEDQALWDVFYHQTASLEEVVASIRDRVLPPVAIVYARYLDEEATNLRRGRLPDSPADSVKDAQQALAILAGARQKVSRTTLATILRWHPQTAPVMAQYLLSRADIAEREVAGHLDRWLKPKTWMDWVSAWLVSVAAERPAVLSEPGRMRLSRAVVNESYGPLTTLAIVRALARSEVLSKDVWDVAYGRASPAVRSEMLLSAVAEADLHKWLADASRLLGPGDSEGGEAR